MRNFIIVYFLLISFSLTAQTCSYQLSGIVYDDAVENPLPFAALYIEETGQGTLADENGKFAFTGICPAEIHLRITHVSCETKHIYLDLRQQKVVNIQLHHHQEILNEITVHGNESETTTQQSNAIAAGEISRNADKNLAGILGNITGVTVLKNGSGIAKPMIQGLYGSRISILNNGIAQGGQQWGIDHAPEIDPFVANHLSVIKGVSSLAYAGSSLGGVVLVEPSAINEDPHLHGELNYIYATNGRGHTLNAKAEQAGNWADYRISGTLKMAGDQHTPDYFLTNTGVREGNAALQLQKKLRENWQAEAYFSTFNTRLGILRGSHLGNLTDLENALHRPVPFFTADKFSYAQAAPQQRVSHHLGKVKLSGILPNRTSAEFIVSLQQNKRREFDVRRGGRSDLPTLSLTQWTFFSEANGVREFAPGATLKTGVQYTITDNTNNPGTGVTPLIPDYRSFNFALFSIYALTRKQVTYEAGVRLEARQMNVVRISREIPHQIIRNNLSYGFYGFSGGLVWEVSPEVSLRWNAGIGMRPPDVNELFSYGLHQGISSFEVGDENLRSEASLKTLFTLNYRKNNRFVAELTPYLQRINNFIYLQPQPEFILTIRGAFPYFKYTQTNALLSGFDGLMSFELTKQFKWIGKMTYVQGQNLTENLPLVLMPPLEVSNSFGYTIPKVGKLSESRLAIEVKNVARQQRYREGQDFLPPPAAYTLVSASANTHWVVGKTEWAFGVEADNLTNIRYRNYLNRLRYYADEAGRNVRFRLNLLF